MENAATEHNALVVYGSYEERGERERMLVESMFAHGADALIIVPGPGGHSWLAEHLASGLTAVFVDRVPDGVPGADGVVLDNATGGRLATEHLLARGHRRIGLVSDARRYPSVHERAEGYRDALREAGAGVDESLVVFEAFDPPHVRGEVTRLLEDPDPPTAFFATNNRAATGVLQVLKQRPADPIALVGFDDFAFAEVFSPGVTVVRYDISQLGRTAVELLLGRVRDPRRRPQQIVMPVELVVRGSGEVRP